MNAKLSFGSKDVLLDDALAKYDVDLKDVASAEITKVCKGEREHL